MKRIVIVGAGGFGREVEMLIEQINAVSHEWQLLGFIDDGVAVGTRVGFSEVLGPVAELMELENIYVVLAIGNPFVKAEIISLIPNHVQY